MILGTVGIAMAANTRYAPAKVTGRCAKVALIPRGMACLTGVSIPWEGGCLKIRVSARPVSPKEIAGCGSSMHCMYAVSDRISVVP